MSDDRHATHFANRRQREQAAELGMWTFLASEALLFSGLFGLYASYCTAYGAAFYLGRSNTAHALGAANTFVLLTSSFSAASALASLRLGRRRASVLLLSLTVGFGIAFLVLKGVEYTDHFRNGMYPGAKHGFLVEHPLRGLPIFVTLYYLMTGLHALHVTAGIVVLSVLGFRVWRGRLSDRLAHPLEFGVLYWHLVDLVWVFLWPMFYFAARGSA
jgi:cytochrome c oxidase subunit III